MRTEVRERNQWPPKPESYACDSYLYASPRHALVVAWSFKVPDREVKSR